MARALFSIAASTAFPALLAAALLSSCRDDSARTAALSERLSKAEARITALETQLQAGHDSRQAATPEQARATLQQLREALEKVQGIPSNRSPAYPRAVPVKDDS